MPDNLDITRYEPTDGLLTGRILVVTGAGDGIGRVAAKTFANFGATVVLVGRTLEKLESIYDEIEVIGGPKPAIFPINFEGAVEQDYEAMHDAIAEEFGRLDGILHNASELGPRTPLANYRVNDWQKLFQVNVTAPFILTKILTPLLEQSDDASVIFTGSSVGLHGRAYWGAYAASKAAQENLMQTLADEYDNKPNLRFNSINPGATRTRMRAAAYPAENPESVTAPETLMNRYLYLIGPDSRGVTGQQFNAQVKK